MPRNFLLVDGSAVFFALRQLYPDSRFDQRMLASTFADTAGINLSRRHESSVYWFTAADRRNEGQAGWLDYLQRALSERFGTVNLVEVHASESWLITPKDLTLSNDSPSAKRLVRFDSSIAFLLGRLASQGVALTIVTDAFSIAGPVVQSARITASPVNVAFFSALRDARWTIAEKKLSTSEGAVRLIDLDEKFGELPSVGGEGRIGEGMSWLGNWA